MYCTGEVAPVSVMRTQIAITVIAIALFWFRKRGLEMHDKRSHSHAMVFPRQIAYLNFFIQYSRICPKRRA